MRKTVLDDDASIYQKKEEETEKQKWSRMNMRQRVQYFLDYYLLKILIGAAVFALVGFIIWSVVKPKPEAVLSVAVLDEQLDEEQTEELIEELHQLYQADGKKKQVMIDDTLYMQDGGLDKLQVYLYNAQIDVVIADLDTYQELAGYGYFRDMSEVLDGRQDAAYAENYVYTAGYKESEEVSFEDGETGQGEKKPYGVDISESLKFQEMKNYIDNPVFSVVNNAPNSDNAVVFLDFLMGSVQVSE